MMIHQDDSESRFQIIPDSRIHTVFENILFAGKNYIFGSIEFEMTDGTYRISKI